jgi:hypothetical protein
MFKSLKIIQMSVNIDSIYFYNLSRNGYELLCEYIRQQAFDLRFSVDVDYTFKLCLLRYHDPGRQQLSHDRPERTEPALWRQNGHLVQVVGHGNLHVRKHGDRGIR